MPNEKLKEFLKELKDNKHIKDYSIRDGNIVLESKRDMDVIIPLTKEVTSNNKVQ